MITVNPTEASLVTLNVSDLTLEIGETYQLTATVYPETTTDSTIIWTSSDSNVVEVSDTGELTANASGMATVTAICGNVYGICNVIVPADESTTIEEIGFDENDDYYRVFNIQGVNIMNTRDKSDLKKLNPGIYIINRKKIVIL